MSGVGQSHDRRSYRPLAVLAVQHYDLRRGRSVGFPPARHGPLDGETVALTTVGSELLNGFTFSIDDVCGGDGLGRRVESIPGVSARSDTKRESPLIRYRIE